LVLGNLQQQNDPNAEEEQFLTLKKAPEKSKLKSITIDIESSVVNTYGYREGQEKVTT
jgi:hypothetical protein